MSIYDEIEQRKAARIKMIREELARSSQIQEEACNHLCCDIKNTIIQAAARENKEKMKSGIWGSKMYYIGGASVAFHISEGCRLQHDGATTYLDASVDFIANVLVQVLRQSRKDGISIYLSTVGLVNSDLNSVKWVEPSESEVKKIVKHSSLEKGPQHWVRLYGRIPAED